MATQQRAAVQDRAQRRKSAAGAPISWAITRTMSVLALAILGLIISLVIEYVGLLWWWRDLGADHARLMLESELDWLNRDFTDVIVSASPVEVALWLAGALYAWSGIEWVLAAMATSPDPDAFFGQFIVHVHALTSRLAEFVVATAYVVQLYGVRLVVVLFSLPVFILFGLVGLVDGLVQRDLRRFRGGVESAFMYHHLKKWLTPVITLSILAYLSLPFSIHPNVIFVPAAMLFAILVAQTCSRFKKFL